MAVAKVAFYDSKSYDKQSFNDVLAKSGRARDFEVHFFEPRLSLETVTFCDGFDAICAFVNDDLSAEVLARLDEQNINLVLLRCAGFDRVDLAAAKDLNISVVRVPAYSPYAVAEFAVALLMALNRKTHRAYNRVRDGNFTLPGLVGFDVYGKTVGVVGTGKIGQCFINIMLGFGCKVLAYDIYPSPVVQAMSEVSYVSLDELFEKSDIISLHAPATPQTTHMINKTSINRMKTGVVIVNTSRGKLIDTKALVDGLIAGRIGAAGLDVYEHEQEYFFRDVSDEEIQDEILARLQNMRNVIITSHQAFLTDEALEAIASTTLRNLKEYFIEKKSMEDLSNYVAAPPPPAAVVRALSRRQSMEAKEA